MFQLVETKNYVQNKQTAGLVLFCLIAGSLLQSNVGCAWEVKVQMHFSVFTGSKQMPSHLDKPFCHNVHTQVTLNAVHAAKCLVNRGTL